MKWEEYFKNMLGEESKFSILDEKSQISLTAMRRKSGNF